MRLSISHQEQYSRGELLLRSFFALFICLAASVFRIMGQYFFYDFMWVVLFTGKYPEGVPFI